MDQFASVFVMRWFQDGASYAYDAHFNQADLTVAVTAMQTVFSEPPGQPFRLLLPDGRVLLGDLQPERECLDERAVCRQPVVVRAALLPHPLSRRAESAVRGHLEALPLPIVAGSHVCGLRVPLPRPVVCPAPVESSPRFGRHLAPWLAVGLLLAMEWGLQFPSGLGGSAVAWVCRVGGLLALLAVYRRWRLPLATQQEMTQREQSLANGEPLAWASLLDNDAWLLLPDGQRLTLATLSTPAAAFLPQAVLNPEYDLALAYPGLAILRGRERLQFADGREVFCLFLRGYTRSRGQWRLKFAQWSRSTQPPVGASPSSVEVCPGEEAIEV